MQGPGGVGEALLLAAAWVGASPALLAEGISGRCQLQTNPFYLLAQVLML